MPVLRNLRPIRDERDLTQRELANMSGLSEASIRKWERDIAATGKSARRLAKALNVTIQQLTGDAPAEIQDMENARLSLRRGADCPGVVALLANEALRASLAVTEGEAALLRDGICGPVGPETEDEAVQLLQAVRYMLARRGSQA